MSRPGGLLVAFEGIDGAGKTTQARLLEERLRARGVEVVRTKEPTDGPWGRKLRASAAGGRLSPAAELEAFLEDRRQHVAELIAPSLARGAVVIVDRYYFSTVAYQGARGLDPQALLAANEAFAPPPDLLFLVEASPQVGLLRIARRGDRANLFEEEANLTRVAAIFAGIDRPYLRRLDGNRPISGLADEIERQVLERLGPRG